MAPPAHRLRAGTLLIANTNLFEPTFRRSVIFIVEHNDGGTLGVVLNRPSETAVYNVLPQWAKLAGKPKTMFVGGPVKRDAALCLATLRAGVSIDGVKGLRHVAGRMAMVDLDAEPEDIAPLVEGIRVFAGYSGWTIGQLEEKSSATIGSCCRRCRPMCSPMRVRTCGPRCFGGSHCRCHCWRPIPSTSAATRAKGRRPPTDRWG